MSVLLTSDLEAKIQKRVESGQYSDASEVVTKALRLLEVEERKLEWLRAEIMVGIEQIERGEIIEDSDEFWGQLDRQVDERVARNEEVNLDEWP